MEYDRKITAQPPDYLIPVAVLIFFYEIHCRIAALVAGFHARKNAAVKCQFLRLIFFHPCNSRARSTLTSISKSLGRLSSFFCERRIALIFYLFLDMFPFYILYHNSKQFASSNADFHHLYPNPRRVPFLVHILRYYHREANRKGEDARDICGIGPAWVL